MIWKQRQQRSREFWQRLPPRSSFLFFAGIFFLFGSIGLIGAAAHPGSFSSALASTLISGATGVVFGYFGTRARYLVLGILFVIEFVVLPPLQTRLHLMQSAQSGLNAAGVAAIVLIVLGYVSILFFIATEGRRFFRLQNEVELAGEIHRSLAPAIARSAAGFELRGISHSSGAVGGDLLDFVESGPGWLCYLADVSGHGVAAGVLMGVVKSSARTLLLSASDAAALLPLLNRSLASLLPPESFVTFAGLYSSGAGGRLQFASAGHGPLLYWHAATGEITRHGQQSFPLGLFPEAAYEAVNFDTQPGDILALFTDGLTELFDRHKNEFGLEGLEDVLRRSARAPLAEIESALLSSARAYSAPTDDQTLILIRRAD